MAIKNQSITITYTAWDTVNNAGKTGDSANHTLRLVQDGTEATPANSPSEVDATNLPGVYKITLTAGEMNYSTVTLGGKSSTSGIVIIPVNIVTEQGNFATVTGKTNNLPASPAGVGDAMTLTSAYDAAKTATQAGDKMDIVDAPSATGANALADALLKRDWTSVTGEATRSCLNAFRILRNARSVSGSTLLVKKEDDLTDAWTASVSTSASAETILGVDPS